MWSRTAQASASCRCRVCLKPLNTVIRRTTTAAPKRKVSVSDVFTACYTTILGSAALADASYKDKTRKELDQKLENARAALNETTAERDLLVARNEQRIEFSERCHTREKSLEQLARESAAYLEVSRSRRRSVNWNAIQAAVAEEEQANWNIVQSVGSFIAEGNPMEQVEKDPSIALREPKSVLQLARTTRTIIQLVDQLLYQVHETPRLSSLDDAHDLLNELDQVRHGADYPNYAMPNQVDNTHQLRTRLSNSIRSIFAQADSSASMVAKICFNLLTSSVPPSMHTYNSLISGFNHIHRPDLAESVIDSYINHTAWPATQQTIVCLLDHYRHNKDLDGFRDIVRRMRGYTDTGLHSRIIRRDSGTKITDLMQSHGQRWASRPQSFVQAAHRGGQVFESLIQGWLSFNKTSAAVMAFVASMRNGAMVSLEIFHQLINACLADTDSHLARKLIIGINNNTRAFLQMLESLNEYSSDLRLGFTQDLSWLLEHGLYRVSEMKGDFGHAQIRRTKTVKLLMNRIGAELELHRISKIISSISEQLTSQVAALVRAPDCREKQSLDLQPYLGASDNSFVRRLRVEDLERRYKRLQNRIEMVSSQAKAAIIEGWSGVDLDPFSVLAAAHADPVLKRGKLALYHALRNFPMDVLPKTENDVKIQLVRGILNPRFAKRLQVAIKGNWEDLDLDVLLSFYRRATFEDQPTQSKELHPLIRQVERRFIKRNEYAKIVLFCSLDPDTQMSLRHLHPNWHKMPFKALYECQLQKMLTIEKELQRAPDDTVSSPSEYSRHSDITPNFPNVLGVGTQRSQNEPIAPAAVGFTPPHEITPAQLATCPWPRNDDIVLPGMS